MTAPSNQHQKKKKKKAPDQAPKNHSYHSEGIDLNYLFIAIPNQPPVIDHLVDPAGCVLVLVCLLVELYPENF